MADEKRDDGNGRNGGRNGPEGRPEGEGGRPDEGRRRPGRHRGFRGRPGGPAVRSGPGGEAQPRRDGQGRGSETQRESRPEEKRELLNCPLCGKPLYDLSTALSAGMDLGEPAHFDCVLERVTAAETLGPGEKVVYLGSGAFGVVEFKDKNETSFVVKRRIQWEKEGEKKEWRKSLSSRISNL